MCEDYCRGCGELKTYRGRPAPSFVCCNSCWPRIPKSLRNAFAMAEISTSGPAPEETAILAWLDENCPAENRPYVSDED